MTRTPRAPIKLADSVHQQPNMYALAAGAAGVGELAFAQPVEARIVYTPAHRAIKLHAIRRVHQTALIQPNGAFLNAYSVPAHFCAVSNIAPATCRCSRQGSGPTPAPITLVFAAFVNEPKLCPCRRCHQKKPKRRKS